MKKVYKFDLNVNDDDDYIAQNDNNQQQDNESLEFSVDDDLYILSEWILIDWCDSNNNSIDDNDNVEIRLSCFAHSLQLAIRDGLTDASYLSKSLSKCIKLAHRSYRSTKITDLLDKIVQTTNRSNITHCNSEFLLIKSIIGLGKKQFMKLRPFLMIMNRN
jgi:hypothetical protein